MDWILSWIQGLWASLFDMSSRLALFYLTATVMLAFILWVFRGRPRGSFLTWLLPKEVYLHKSNIVDIKVFLFNSMLSAAGMFTAIGFTPVVTVWLLGGLVDLSGQAHDPEAVTWWRSAMATLVMILTLDFCKYWAHYLHHETKFLWPFHALHHSAEVMTPLTANRNHPVFLIIRTLIYSVIVGAVQAVMLFALIGKIDLLTIGSVNAGYFLFNLFGANFRHSHIWVSYGPVLEHILISPAQHHIHHSMAKKHHNKNYGEVFAIWDLMFGTLYVPKQYEALSFGLADEHGNPVEQPHTNLRSAILLPFLESWRALKGMEPDSVINRDEEQGHAAQKVIGRS